MPIELAKQAHSMSKSRANSTQKALKYYVRNESASSAVWDEWPVPAFF
jgi:hypothetical protein